MKHFILTFILYISVGNLFAQNSRVDTIVNAIWNGTTWQNHFRTINNYDADCRLKNALTQNWDVGTGKWLDYSIGTYSYVSGNYVSEILTQFWFNNSWMNNYRETYTYDAFFKTQSVTGQTWSVNHWSNYTYTVYKYDNYGYADSVLIQSSYSDAPFENTYLNIFTNNSDGNHIQTINQNWNKTILSWDNYLKSSFVYNNRKTIDTSVTVLWNNGAALWQFHTRTLYTYTGAGKLFYYTNQEWQTNQWVNQSEYTSSYDNNGFVSNVLGQRWDGFDFENYNQNTYKNNSDGTIYQHVAQYWSEAVHNWVNSTRETWSYSSSCVLPLQLLLFTATKNNNTVNLNWQVADEINSSRYTIQRSLNGTSFTSINDISAKAGAGTHSYGYTDCIENVTADKIYYRLNIINKDGSSAYSKIVPVALTAYTGVLKVYPNPAKDQLFVLFKIQKTDKPELRITDISGNPVYSNTVNSNQDNCIAGIDISALSKGMYYVLLISGNNTQRAQFLKQ